MPAAGRPSLWQACRTWLWIGATGFGGPAGQIALLHRELVERRRWLEEREFLAALKVCMLLPGPEAQQLATYAGWRLGGMIGGIVAGTLFVLPGALLVTAFAWLHAAGRDLPGVSAAFTGTRPAVVALVVLAAWRIARQSLRSPATLAAAMAASGALAWGVPFPVIVAVAGLLGYLAPVFTPVDPGDAVVRASGGESNSGASARGGLRHAALVLGVAVAVWSACYAVVCVADGLGPSIATLFTKTTLLSFGGAYAVVPWALEESLTRGWLEPGDRFAALAMGEAVPGPLILVVTFIGFLAGWRANPYAASAGGLTGAATATAFAFIPAFAMVLAVAPAVSSIHPTSGLGRALAAVSAAVVAAIALLAVTLAGEALLTGGRIDVASVTVALLSAMALAWWNVPTPVVVLGAAAIGVLRWTA